MEKMLLIPCTIKSMFPETWVSGLNILSKLSLTGFKSWPLMQFQRTGFLPGASIPVHLITKINN